MDLPHQARSWLRSVHAQLRRSDAMDAFLSRPQVRSALRRIAGMEPLQSVQQPTSAPAPTPAAASASSPAQGLDDRQQATGQHWDRVLAAGRSGLRLHWWEDPQVLRHINKIVCGEPIDGLHAGFHRRLCGLLPDDGRPLRALSVGAGTGHKEYDLLMAPGAERIEEFHCYDVAPAAVEQGRRMVETHALEGRMFFHLADAFRSDLGSDWDLVYWNNALHHMYDTAAALAWSRDRLRPGGLLAIDDYIGPSQFQWSDRMVQRCTDLLALLPPEKLRHPQEPERIVRTAGARPPAEHVAAVDPSEAVDSANILPAVQRLFPDAEIIFTGGAAYFIALDELFENFATPDELRLLGALLLVDQTLAEAGETAYGVIFARKP